MFNFKKILDQFLFILIATTLLFAVSSRLENQQTSEKPYTSISTLSRNISVVISSSRLEQSCELIAILKNIKLLHSIKILFYILALCLIFKGKNRKVLRLLWTLVQYFIHDPKIDLLSSRAHPPTH